MKQIEHLCLGTFIPDVLKLHGALKQVSKLLTETTLTGKQDKVLEPCCQIKTIEHYVKDLYAYITEIKQHIDIICMNKETDDSSDTQDSHVEMETKTENSEWPNDDFAVKEESSYPMSEVADERENDLEKEGAKSSVNSIDQKSTQTLDSGSYMDHESTRESEKLVAPESHELELQTTEETQLISSCSSKVVSTHVEDIHPTVVLECSCRLCNLTFNSNVLLRAHLEKKHKSLPQFSKESVKEITVQTFSCGTCGKKFKQKRSVASCKHKSLLKDGSKRELKHACAFCDKSFYELKGLREHAARIHGEREIKTHPCIVCNKTFVRVSDYYQHLQVSHPEYVQSEFPHKCEFCDSRFATILSMSCHIRSFHKDMQVNLCCESCGKTFPKFFLLHRHRKVHRNPEGFPCSRCGRRFRTAQAAKEHMNIHTGHKPFVCEICDQMFHTLSAKNNHKTRTHVGDYNSYKCVICKVKCNSTFGRNSHYLTHTEEERMKHNIILEVYKCNICGKVMRKEYMKRHKSKHEETFCCEQCGENFESFHSLKQHIEIHGPEQVNKLVSKCTKRYPYLCDICGKNLSSKSALWSHKKRHADINKQQCTVCNKACASKTSLLYHMKTHNGEMDYRCEICGKGFLYPGSLTTHKQSHSTEKAFLCQICGASFKYHGNKQRHINSVHRKNSRFPCEVCGKIFYQKIHLTVHRRQHTGEKPYKCDICGKRFADPSTAYKHKTKHQREVNGINMIST